MKIVLTGGHFSPAYSVISELKKRGHEVTIIGRRHPFEGDNSESFEYLTSTRENIPFYEIKTGRFRRRFSAYTFFSLLKTPAGFFNAIKLLKKIKPDVVMTFGGYIGFPVAYAAKILGIRVLLHEQTQKVGLSSRLIGGIADLICISFVKSKENFNQSKTVFTGNPIREDIFKKNKNLEIPSGKVLYITGGSTGSHFINTSISKIIPDLLEKFVIIHQTGDSKFNDFEMLNSLRESLNSEKKKKYILKKFVYPDEVGSVLERSDLIISRSGINTIFEIMAMKKISLLIPLPYGQNNEQLDNAKLIKELDIGDYIEQQDITPEILTGKIIEMFSKKEVYEKNMDRADRFIVRDAASRIVDSAEKLC